MQTVNRCAYALAAYDSNTQRYNEYMENKVRLENTCKEISSYAREHLSGTEFISTHARYSSDKHICLCYYKGHIFAGFQDKATNQLSLNDLSGDFVKMANDTAVRLEQRMINAINDEKNGKPNIMSQQVCKLWEPLIPLMNQIIEYEEKFEKLPEKIQDAMRHNATYDTQINKIVEKFECERSSNKENTVIEQSICNISLSKRFSDAQQETMLQKKLIAQKPYKTKELGD